MSTHGGNSKVRECRVVTAWRGLGAVVDTARMIDTGWFQPSIFEGTLSPSRQCRSSSHHGDLLLSLAGSFSRSATHLWHRWLIRSPIQSIVLAERFSSSSMHAFSTCFRSENRIAKVLWGTVTRLVVRVVTCGNGEKDCNISSSGGRDEVRKSCSKSGEDETHT